MVKELYKEITVETTLNVTNSRIDSVRKKNITKSGCRVYDGKYIGIAGTLGNETEETWKEATENLKLQVAYKYPPESNKKRSRNLCKNADSDNFVADAEQLMEQLRNEFPDFIFSNKLILRKTTTHLTNDIGLDYENTDCVFEISLTVKHVKSINIFDTVVARSMRTWDVEAFMKESRDQLKAFNREASLPAEEKILTAVDFRVVGQKFGEYLHGRMVGKGGSPLATKFGQQLFSPDITLYADRNDDCYLVPFFDTEGSTCENDRCALVEKGVLLHPYTDKMNADEFGFINTACAGGGYDDVPALSIESLSLQHSGKTLAELTDGKEWINAILVSGGDCTNEGDFTSPVQLAYLMKGTEYIGKLPEFNLSGNLYEYFGDDYVGTSSDFALFGERVNLFKMKVNT